MRILIIDDRPAMRTGLRALLSAEPSFELVGEAESCIDSLEQIATLRPDVALVGVPIWGTKGVETLVMRLRESHAGLKVVYLLDCSKDSAPPWIPCGADAYLVSSSPAHGIVGAIANAAQGQKALDHLCAERLFEQYEAALWKLARRKYDLSIEDLEILRKLATGATHQEIGAALYMSEITVIRKVKQLVDKLGAENKTQAVVEAVRRCII